MKGLNSVLVFSCFFLLTSNLLASANPNYVDTSKAAILFMEGDSLAKMEAFSAAILKYDAASAIYLTHENYERHYSVRLKKSEGLILSGNIRAAQEELAQTLAGIKKNIKQEELLMASVNNLMAVCAYYTQDYINAMEHFKESTRIMSLYYEVHEVIVDNMISIGACFEISLNFDSSLVYNRKALAMQLGLNGGKEDFQVSQIYNNFGTAFYQMDLKDSTNYYFKKALNLRKTLFGENHSSLAQSYRNYGVFLEEKLFEYDSAKYYYNLSLSMELKRCQLCVQVADLYSNLGGINIKEGNYYSALDWLQKSADLLKIISGKEDKYLISLGIALGNMGAAYYELGQPQLALFYHKEALRNYTEVHKTKKHYDFPIALNNIANAYAELNDLDNSLFYFKQALEKNKQLKAAGKGGSSKIIANLINIGDVLGISKEYEEALKTFNQVLTLLNQTTLIDYYQQGTCYTSMARIYKERKAYNKALSYYQLALNAFEKVNSKSHPSQIKCLANIGVIEDARGDYKKALATYQIIFDAIFKTSKVNNHAINISIIPVSLQRVLLPVYHFKALTLKNMFEKEGDLQKLTDAVSAISICEKILDQLRKDYVKDRLSLNELAAKIYLDGIEINYQLFEVSNDSSYLEKTFLLSEKNKGTVLLFSLMDNRAKSVAGIPDSILRREKELSITVAKLEKKVMADSSDSYSQKLLFKNERDYLRLINLLEQEHKSYYNLKYEWAINSVKAIQNRLKSKENEVIVSYTVGKKDIYITLINAADFQVLKIKKDFPLEKWVHDLTKEGIYGYYTVPKNQRNQTLESNTITNYTRAAQQLYEKLIAPIKGKLTQKITIIPDGILGYIPFEALLTKQPPRVGAFKAYPFLIKEHQISYCYSTTLLKEMQEKKHQQNPKKSLLAIAPFYMEDVPQLKARIDTSDFSLDIQTRDSLGKLVASGVEVASITKIWKGEALYNEAATIEAFYKMAEEYQIIHLSTHGKADDRVGDYAYLAFNTSENKAYTKLYARDLYNLSFNTDMVMLSACETGIGKLQKGEGIISLARAFAYAGAKSIFTTLWKVDDEKTKDLVIEFYKKLKQGKAKDEALHLAKLAFLQKHKGKGISTHPFFWAGMIGIGDMRPLEYPHLSN